MKTGLLPDDAGLVRPEVVAVEPEGWLPPLSPRKPSKKARTRATLPEETGIVEQLLSLNAGELVRLPQPIVPAWIPIDLTIVWHRRRQSP